MLQNASTVFHETQQLWTFTVVNARSDLHQYTSLLLHPPTKRFITLWKSRVSVRLSSSTFVHYLTPCAHRFTFLLKILLLASLRIFLRHLLFHPVSLVANFLGWEGITDINSSTAAASIASGNNSSTAEIHSFNHQQLNRSSITQLKARQLKAVVQGTTEEGLLHVCSP